MKNDLKNSKTFLNLAKAFAGECQAHVRYKFIEYGARNEGYASLAEIIDKVPKYIPDIRVKEVLFEADALTGELRMEVIIRNV